MELDVPNFKQEDRGSCGSASLRMVFNYCGKNYSEKEILDGAGGLVPHNKDGDLGTLTIDNVMYAASLGFRGVCHTYNMELLPAHFKDLSNPDLRKGIERLLDGKKDTEDEKENKDKRILETYLQVMDSGIALSVRMPSMHNIRGFLNYKIPVILAVNSRILFEKDLNLTMGHFIVITGHGIDLFHYNDPLDGQKKDISEDKLFFALSNNILDGSAYLMAIS